MTNSGIAWRRCCPRCRRWGAGRGVGGRSSTGFGGEPALAHRGGMFRSGGPWETLYSVFLRWQIDGTRARILQKLQPKADVAGHIAWEVSLDSTICRVHQHAAGAWKKGGHNSSRTRPDGLPSEPADHAIGRSRGGLTTKIHLAVDSSFQVLAAVVTAGQRGDAALCTEVMNRIRVPRPGGGRPHTRPVHVLADRAYSSP